MEIPSRSTVLRLVFDRCCCGDNSNRSKIQHQLPVYLLSFGGALIHKKRHVIGGKRQWALQLRSFNCRWFRWCIRWNDTHGWWFSNKKILFSFEVACRECCNCKDRRNTQAAPFLTDPTNWMDIMPVRQLLADKPFASCSWKERCTYLLTAPEI